MEIAGSLFHIWAVFALIIVAIVLFANERIDLEISSLVILSVLLLLFYLFPLENAAGENLLPVSKLLAGFADPALITVIALLVVGQGVVRTGALEQPIRILVTLRRHHPMLAIIVVLTTVMVVSAFMNNTPVVVIFIPLMAALAERLRRSPASLMMPLSFVSILGGMTTLIGSSTNLLVMGAAVQAGQRPLTFFEFTVPGAILAVSGLLYAVFIVPRLLADRSGAKGTTADDSGKQFIVQLGISPESPLVGEAAVAGQFPSLRNITIRFIQRGEKILLPPFDDVTLRPSDEVVFAGTRKSITQAVIDNPQILQGFLEVEGAETEDGTEFATTKDQMLAEAVVAPASRMIGRALHQINFHYRTKCIVVGIQRRSRMIRTSRMADIRLEAGDVLLLLGKRSDMVRLRSNPDVLLLEWSARELPATSLARRARIIFGVVVVLAALDIVPIVIASIIGAVAMVLTGCLNVFQAGRAIDQKIIYLIGASLGLGAALQATGGAIYLADAILSVMQGAPPVAILSAFFLLVAIMTNILSNNATAVLFTPIGIGIAHQLGVDPMVFIYAVVFAASCSFATPIGYQTNLLVMGPGHYTFMDFVKAGSPLVILLWLVFTFMAPMYFALG